MPTTDESRQEWIEERAGILEFEAGRKRDVAEWLAEYLWVEWEAAHDSAR